jgi:dTMP kinase
MPPTPRLWRSAPTTTLLAPLRFERGAAEYRNDVMPDEQKPESTDAAPVRALAGKFLVVDGPDGSGKGAQLDQLQGWIESAGGRVRRARDPGGTEIGDRIRHVLLGYDLSQMAPRCEALLFMASRAQLVHQVIRPALAAGETVLCDRFISATCAYQVAAGFPREEVIALGGYAVGDAWPDLTLILDVPPEVGFARTGRKPRHVSRRGAGDVAGQHAMFDGATPDAMERRPLEYHRTVRELFRGLPAAYPRPVVVIDAAADVERVSAAVRAAVLRTLVADADPQADGTKR